MVEARIIAAQNDALQTLRILDDAIEIAPKAVLQIQTEDLLDALTGGQFQSADREPDAERVRRIAGSIGKFRTDIMRARMKHLAILQIFRGSAGRRP